MKNAAKTMIVVFAMTVGCTVFAGPHHLGRHHRDGFDLAVGIVNLVTSVIAPQPVVVAPAPVVTVPAPVVVTPAPVVINRVPAVRYRYTPPARVYRYAPRRPARDAHRRRGPHRGAPPRR